MTQLEGFKFVTTLFLVFKMIESDDKTKYDTFHLHSKAKKKIDESDIDNVLKSIYTTIISNMQAFLGKGGGWIIDSVVNHNINISKYNTLAGSRYIKLPRELDNARKGLINIQNIDDNECFLWCLVRYLHTTNCNQQELQKQMTEIFQKDLVLKT